MVECPTRHSSRGVIDRDVNVINLQPYIHTKPANLGWLRGTVGRTSVFDRRTFAVLRSTRS